MNRLILNETTYFGAGSLDLITTEIAKRSLKFSLLVTDNDLIKHGITVKVCQKLERANIQYQLFSDIKPNPTTKNVQDGLRTFNLTGADFIIALGGGSVLDTAKAIGIIAANPEYSDVRSLEGFADTKNRSIPIIAIPTTAGTASEVTINYVITDEISRKKMVCIDPNSVPILSIVDCELMYTMPKQLTAATGMDALTHAIEGYITKGAWEMSDMFEVKAIELIAKHLKHAVDNGTNKEAREGMALAQYIAGMGFSNVGLGITHSMAHPLGAYYDTPHGVANALLLPFVMEYNADSPAAAKYPRIAESMGVNLNGKSEEEAVHLAIKAVRDLSLSIGIPQKLRELGVREADIPMLAEAAFNDICTGGNPRDTSPEDIESIYRLAL